MNVAMKAPPTSGIENGPFLLDQCEGERLLAGLRRAVTDLVAPDGRTEQALLDHHQYPVHGFAWQATYVEALRRILRCARALAEAGRLTRTEEAIRSSRARPKSKPRSSHGV